MGVVSIVELFERAANDRQRGATEIERDLLLRLVDGWPSSGGRMEVLRAGADRLRKGQPCMANLLRVAALIGAARQPQELQAALEQRLETLLQLGTLLGRNALPILLEAEILVTISRSSAVFAAVNGAVQEGWSGRLFVLDGSPSGRGQEQAERLRRLGLDLRSLPDAAMLEAFDEASVAMLVLCGADAVGSKRIVNSQGTQLLAETAGARGVRRILVADSGKDLQEAEIDRILAASPQVEESPGRKWPVFEACPMELFDGRVREDGFFSLRKP